MSSKGKKIVAAMVLGFGLNATAFGEDAKVMTGGESAKIGVEFRSEILRDDLGLQKPDNGPTPNATTALQVQAIKLKLAGNISPANEYKFRFNLLGVDSYGAKQTVFDYGYVTHWFGPMFGLSMGKEKVMQGGWDTIDDSFRDHWVGAYANNRAFAKYDKLLALHLKSEFGQFNLQLINDKVCTTCVAPSKTEDRWNKTPQTTVALGFLGKFGPVEPIVDYGAYDNQKSKWYDVGIKTAMSGLGARFDYRGESVSHPYFDTDGSRKGHIDTGNALTLKVDYDVPHIVTPYIYYSSYTAKPASEVKGNKTIVSDPAKYKAAAPASTFNNNGTVTSVGVNLGVLGNGYTPYLAYTNYAGKYINSATDNTVTTAKSESWIRLGILGEF